jgi:hypothetical protein
MLSPDNLQSRLVLKESISITSCNEGLLPFTPKAIADALNLAGLCAS